VVPENDIKPKLLELGLLPTARFFPPPANVHCAGRLASSFPDSRGCTALFLPQFQSRIQPACHNHGPSPPRAPHRAAHPDPAHPLAYALHRLLHRLHAPSASHPRCKAALLCRSVDAPPAGFSCIVCAVGQVARQPWPDYGHTAVCVGRTADGCVVERCWGDEVVVYWGWSVCGAVRGTKTRVYWYAYTFCYTILHTDTV
jgi:hypothetical protein